MNWDRINYRTAAAALGASVVFSLVGLSLMRFVPVTTAQAGALLPLLMKAPTWVYMVALPLAVFWLYRPQLGWKSSLGLLVWGSLVGMVAELLGTTTGLPFGTYSYTNFLEPQILGHVPYLIPPSWYAMGLVSWELAHRFGQSRALRVLITGSLMVLWDVALDPAMGAAFPMWEWHVDGFFYGMPAINWLGWLLTGMVIAYGYEILARGPRLEPENSTVTVWIWSSLLPVGVCLLRGFTGAALAGAVAVSIPLLWLALRNLRRRAAGAVAAEPA